jgi:dipeptidyl-peptidase-4
LFDLKRAALIFCLASISAVPSSFASDTTGLPYLAQGLDAMFNKGAFWGKGVQLAWENGGDAYTILEPSADGKGTDIVAYETATGKRTVQVSVAQLTPPNAKASLDIEEYSWSADGKKLLVFTNAKKVWREYTRGDYWVYDTAAAAPESKLVKLGGDAPESTLMFATFSPDGNRVAYVRANNIYVEELATKKITQLTTDGSPDIINGTSDWVNEEELFLRNCIRWSPDSRQIAYWQFDQFGVGEYTLINDTEAEYPVTFKYKYPQPGTTNSAVRVGIVDAAGGATRWVKLAGDPRQNYVAQMDWAGNSDGVLIEYLNRAQNDNQFIWANAQTGETRVVTEDTDKDWVDVFSMEWIEKGNAAGAKANSAGAAKDALFLSERDGWRHAYRLDLATGQPHLVTNFQGDVLEKAAIDQQGGWFYFLASPDDPVRQYLYRARVDGSGSPERVTPADEPGVHAYDIAANAKWAVHRYGTADKPTRIEIVSLPDHKLVRTLVDNSEVAARVQPYLSSKTEFFKVPVDNGVTLDGYMIKPPDFDAKKKYPVVTYVYGEPWVATVRDEWDPFIRMIGGLIAEEGYIFISIDNEGTPSPKGREWRKSIYGAIGVLSSAQQTQAINALAKDRAYIDTSRMAIWGHSGGGSTTLNVMFRYPGVYSTGIALAPVADESHYDSIYQERYMGQPAVNVKGYHDGSPINFAEGLKGHLLVIHGSGDDNVHYQGTELLINRLVELGKPFDFMDYPNRTHSLSEGKGTSFHVFSLVTRFIEEHVPPGGVAQ